VGCGLKQ